jgi:hypothetical protein
MSAIRILDRRLRRLEDAQQNAATPENRNRISTFRVTPTCPPSKRLYISNGILYPVSIWFVFGGESAIPDWTCDFEDATATQMTLNFTNANYYLGIILCYWYEWLAYSQSYTGYDNPVFNNVIGTEVATAAEAEAEIDSLLNGSSDWFYERLPLHGVVLKNDGNVGVDYAILPIDLMPRGGSYLYRDARARNCLVG